MSGAPGSRPTPAPSPALARARVLIAAGTDFGGGPTRADQLAWEVECLVTAGLEPWQALAAATRNGGELSDSAALWRVRRVA